MGDTQLAVADPQALESATVTPSALLSKIMELARDPEVRPDVVAAFLSMQERLEDRQAERAFNAAFVAMQPNLPRIKKDGTLLYPVNKNNPDGPKREISKYAKWETIDEAIRPLLTEYGFVLTFNVAPRVGDGGGLTVIAVLRHRAGHKTETPMPVPLDTSGGKNNLQGYGSALSYGKRYAATAILNIITEGEDDDGKRGGERFITEAQADELRALCGKAGRQEGTFLDRMFSGGIRSFEELPPDAAYIAVRNTLETLVQQREARQKKTEAS
jgi:hypothetical protein